MPPLRERPEDIARLIDHFLDVYRERFNRPGLDVSTEGRQLLQNYSWPGNIRELRNCLERAAAITTDDMIGVAQLPFVNAPGGGATPTAGSSPGVATQDGSPITLEELEREHILRVLNESNGNRERAAALLGISSRTLYRKIREYENESKSGGLATEV